MTNRSLLFLTILVTVTGLALTLDPMGVLESKGTENLKTVRVGVLPDENEETLRNRYQPLFKHLAKATGLDIELVVPRNYSHLLELFGQKKVDIAYFGGFTFVKAHKQFGAVPMVMRDTDVRFRSYFMARRDRTEKTINDFQGKSLAFGSKLSTSGHLMPRHFLKDKGISPEAFFGQIKYSGAHDKTGLMVKDGIVDLGVANAAIIETMFADGRLKTSDVRIVWKTPPYPDYIWAARKEIAPEVRKTLVSEFLQLTPTDKTHAQILGRINAGGFLPARLDDFRKLNAVAESLGML